MLGYRLVRETEYAELKSDLRKAQVDIINLLNTLADARAKVGQKATMADMLTLRVNTLEHELGTLKHHATGLPVLVPAIGKGTPMQSAALGAGVDLFEDVGDEAAEELRKTGQLHDSDFDLSPPAAKDLLGTLGE
jgi:hypothetical protein